MTDREWALLASFMPTRKTNGRPRTTALRDVLDAILYMASPIRQWAMLPNDFPSPSTVQHYFYDWRDSGLLRTMNHHLVMEAPELEGREATAAPYVAIMPSPMNLSILPPCRQIIGTIKG